MFADIRTITLQLMIICCVPSTANAASFKTQGTDERFTVL